MSMRTRHQAGASRVRLAGNQTIWLFGRDIAGSLGKALDPLLDVFERFEAGFNRVGRDILQHIGCNSVAQTVEIIDKLTAALREEQPVGASIPGIVPPLEKTMLDQTIEQAHQRDRLQFKDIGQIDLRQSLLLPPSEQYDPLRARGAAALGAVVDVISQQARTLDELGNQLPFEIERHELWRSQSFPKV